MGSTFFTFHHYSRFVAIQHTRKLTVEGFCFFLKPEFIQVSRPGLKSTGDTWTKHVGRVCVWPFSFPLLLLVRIMFFIFISFKKKNWGKKSLEAAEGSAPTPGGLQLESAVWLAPSNHYFHSSWILQSDRTKPIKERSLHSESWLSAECGLDSCGEV